MIMAGRLTFKTPFAMYLVGQSNSGKTVWISKLIEEMDTLFDKQIDKIIYCYGVRQPFYEQLSQNSRVFLNEGPMNLSEIRHFEGRKLVIFDDLCSEVNDKSMFEIFSRGVHHSDINFVFITQDAFMNKRSNRINCTYLVLMRSPADRLQILNLSRQLFPENIKYMTESYTDATSRPYGYLVIDNHALTDPSMRLITNIFKDEQPTIVYTPKNSI